MYLKENQYLLRKSILKFSKQEHFKSYDTYDDYLLHMRIQDLKESKVNVSFLAYLFLKSKFKDYVLVIPMYVIIDTYVCFIGSFSRPCRGKKEYRYRSSY